MPDIRQRTERSIDEITASINETLDRIDGHLYELGVQPIASHDVVSVPTCPVCESSSAKRSLSIDGVAAEVVVCAECGLGRLHPLPTPQEIASFYPADYYGDAGRKFHRLTEWMVRLVARRSAKFLCRGLSAGSRVLDVGCGRGVLLREFADAGFETHGFEISSDATRGADPRAEIRTAGSLSGAEYPSNWFDRVVIWHVLEHVTQPRETVAEIHRILKPGGQIVVAVPNFSSWQARWAGPDWFHLDLPRHLSHFPVGALKRLLDGCGFDVVGEHHFSLRQNPFGWVQSSLNRSRVVPRNSLYMMLQPEANEYAQQLGRLSRFRAWMMHWLGMPFAVGLSAVAALFRQGASVHLVGRARK